MVEVEPPANVPAAPADLAASGISSSGAQLTWTATTNTDIYKVYGKVASEDDDAYTLKTTATLPQAQLTGLSEGVTYSYFVVATNGRGDSERSNVVTFTTAAPLYKFDVQLAGNPLEAGYTEFNQNTLYTPELGYGLTSAAPGGRDRGSAATTPPVNISRDFLLPGAATTMQFDVANGTYAVRLLWGDAIGTAALNPTIEGVGYGNANTGRNTLGSRTLQPVKVSDGNISLGFAGNSWLNAIEITPLQVAPTGLTVDEVTIDGSDVAVDLSWTEAAGATAYRVYRTLADGSGRTALDRVTGTSYTDTTADVGQTYLYTVVALDAAGNESVPSNEVEVTTVDPGVAAPAAPTRLAVGEVTKNSVQLTWQASPDALFYQVYRTAPGKPQNMIGRTSEPAYTDTGVLTTVKYTYMVAAVNAGGVSPMSAPVTSPANTKLARTAERLDRSPVAVKTSGGVYVGWRMLGLDPSATAFNVYRDGVKVTPSPLTESTNLLDAGGTNSSTYRITTVINGIERYATESFRVWSSQELTVPIDKPADAYTKDGQPYSYRANDASVGDVDGDGEYEIILKWDPTNSKDNSQSGYTGNVYVDAYEMDGTRLWRIDLGVNIRAGAHYTQFQVYDFDSDGDAEVMMKTADGTVDGQGQVIGDLSADYRNSSGYILDGPEFLTVFNGRTGAEIDTVDYLPGRGTVADWGDGYGNRVDRFLAGVAYLDGEHPSAIFSRGYYTRSVIAAWDFNGSSLSRRWVFDTNVAGSQYEHQGNHSLSVADVDQDQKDEIIYGSITIDDDGDVKYNTDLGHGDALHVSDFDIDRPGLEAFAPHEAPGGNGNKIATFRDAKTGEILWSVSGTRDTGRGAAGDIDPRHRGAEAWNVGDGAAWNSPDGYLHSASGQLIGNAIPAANFVTWWDGDLLREITDHDWTEASRTGVPTISKWNYQGGTSSQLYRASGTLSNNDTKGTPTLQADLFGDWREELVTRTDDSRALKIATTVDVTASRIRTLQHDSQYRQAVAWQNTGYNQPPHPSFFIGAGMADPAAPSIAYTGTDPGPGEALDKTAPVVSPSVTSATRKVTLTAFDADTGVESIQYRFGTGAWQTYSAPVTVPARATTVSYRATDLVGNVSLVGSLAAPATPKRLVPLGITVTTSCVNGKVAISTSALNQHTSRTQIKITSRVRTTSGAIGRQAVLTANHQSTAAVLPGGTVSVYGYSKVGNVIYTTTYKVPYGPVRCG